MGVLRGRLGHAIENYYHKGRDAGGGPSSTIGGVTGALLAASIPAPSVRQISLGPFDIRLYALCLLAGVAVATWLTMRRWTARGGEADLVFEVALWSVLAGILGGRLYHVITSWDQLGDEWYAPFAIWEGGLGIWGGVLAGVLTGAYITHRRGESVFAMMDAAAPGILIAQGIGRLGNYFNQELFGGPTDLPWGLEVSLGFRPVGEELTTTFHPTFLYEMLWNFAGAALIIWLGPPLPDRGAGHLLPLRGRSTRWGGSSGSSCAWTPRRSSSGSASTSTSPWCSSSGRARRSCGASAARAASRSSPGCRARSGGSHARPAKRR